MRWPNGGKLQLREVCPTLGFFAPLQLASILSVNLNLTSLDLCATPYSGFQLRYSKYGQH